MITTIADWRAAFPRPRHLYLHIPFCHRRCSYCDFNTYANIEHRMAAYVDALCAELGTLAAMPPAPAPPDLPGLTRGSLRPTIFLGGGTPSMLPLDLMERVLAAADAIVPLAGAEVTVEANPGTVLGRGYLKELRALGVNRLSMGVQSLHDPTLRVLGRIHTADDARASFEDARAAGFESINLDFIFGLPGQTQQQWAATLDEIVTWGADHFSLYSLILEERTPLYAQVTSGRLSIPDDDETGAMYECAIERLGAGGYVQYEISNWARDGDTETGRHGDTETRRRGDTETRDQRPETREPSPSLPVSQSLSLPASRSPSLPVSQSLGIPRHACHHNLAYWLNADYLGCGAGAHGHLYPRRYSDVLGVEDYIGRAPEGRAVAEVIELGARDLAAETMFMGLRLSAGVSEVHFRDRCGVTTAQVFGVELAELAELGLIERDTAGVRLTERGRMLGNRVFERFV